MNPDGSDYIKQQIIGKGVVVAIDGPSGSGKSTVSRLLAAEMDAQYLDTGAMYRAVAWFVLEQGISPSDKVDVEKCLAALDLRVEAVPHAPRIFVGETNVTKLIREERVTLASSEVSSLPKVRETLIAKQREIIAAARESGRGIVAEGRDITTVVVPDATVRVLLTASEEARMARRAGELHLSAEDVRDQTLGRDKQDSATTSFLEAAEGVHAIDSTSMNADQVKDAIIDLIRDALHLPHPQD